MALQRMDSLKNKLDERASIEKQAAEKLAKIDDTIDEITGDKKSKIKRKLGASKKGKKSK